MVLFIITLFAVAMLPAMQSTLNEDKVRTDSRQLSLMVRTAMLQSAEQHRPYAIDLTSTNMSLHPVIPPAKESDVPATSFAQEDAAANTTPEDIEIRSSLDTANKLLALDPRKNNVWIAMPETSWIFQPGELCPASRVRVGRGDSWLEMSFNALTGTIEDEATYFP